MGNAQFKAFIDDVLEGRDGPWALKTSEIHQRKTPEGGYETTARTFRTVKGDIDFSRFAKGDLVFVAGVEKTEKRTHDGKDYYDLVVWADAVSTVPRKGAGSHQGASDGGNQPQGVPVQGGTVQEPWATAQPGGGFGDDTNVPF